MMSDLHRIQYENDEAAFKRFYEAYVFKLFQFAFAFVQDKGAAEEIVNDVFLKLWQQRGRLDSISNLNVYLYVAIKNTSGNYLRKQKSRLRMDLESVTVSHFFLSPDPEQAMVTAELRRAIERSINQLPPKCKLIFKLVKEDGLSMHEVGSILNLSYKTVHAQLSIALKKLEVVLQPDLRGYLKRV
jgi:RNA polymerase sigma-70 factor (ECF subfamily)